MWKKDFCHVVMPYKCTKILDFNQYHKSDKTLSVICTDLKPLVKKIDGCKNNFCKIICNKSK